MINTFTAKEVLNDETLLAEFQDRKVDCFAKVAKSLCGTPSHEVSEDQCLKAKAYIHFHARRLRLNRVVRQNRLPLA